MYTKIQLCVGYLQELNRDARSTKHKIIGACYIVQQSINL